MPNCPPLKDDSLRACVFCGGPPIGNVPEHILPTWLIELTGDPKRTVTFGMNWRDSPPMPITHSFSKFRFPACKRCNNEFSVMEGAASTVVRKMLADELASSSDLDILLDWLDKVRVGLWLALRMRDRNYMGIEPSFFIRDRVGKADRILCIYKGDMRQNRLSFFGTESPIFRMMPSCFLLVINHLHFFSVSNPFMLHRTFGFPVVTQTSVRPNTELRQLTLSPGCMRLDPPFAPLDVRAGGSEIYQAVVPSSLENQNRVEFRILYGCEHVQNLLRDNQSGKTNLIKQDTSGIRELSKYSTIDLSSIEAIDARALRNSLIFQVLDWQEHMKLESMSVFLDRFTTDQIDTFARRQNKLLYHHRTLRNKVVEWIDSTGL